jgi:hypothetical protein
MTQFVAHFDTVCDYTLRFTITHTHTPTRTHTRVMSSLLLLGSGFQWWMFPYLWGSKFSLASANSNSSQQLNPSSSRTDFNSESKSCYDWRSLGQYVLVWSTRLEPKTRFLLLSDTCGFVDVGCLLCWEDGSVIYNCCWPSLGQSFSGPSPVGLIIFYSLRF